ncbi:MAG: zinc ribbon domain-containing protein [Euryarchaeota archaeon]
MNGNENNVPEISQNSCPQCGIENNENAKFCIECGQSILIQEKENVCYGCGIISPAGTKFCPECGQNLTNQEAPVKSVNKPNNGLRSLIKKDKSITQRRSLTSKLASDVTKAAMKATEDIKKSVEDYTLAVEAEIKETEDSFIVAIELPKIEKEDLDIHITPRKINLKAEFDHEIEIEQGTIITRRETQRGFFNKDIILRKDIIPDESIAEFEDDHLIIKLPKADFKQGFKLKI